MKEYIKPTINIQQVVVEQLLASESGGQFGNKDNPADAKRNDFWADEDESYEASSTAEDWH